MSDPFLPYLPIDEIRAAYSRADGNEYNSGKMNSLESSSALVANTFGYFLNRADQLSQPPCLDDVDWPPTRVQLEECARFPWAGGRHPWLDVMIETKAFLIGVESKRYEPFRSTKAPEFRPIYSTYKWDADTLQLTSMRDQLMNGSVRYEHLDAAQLVKHAFGLCTQAGKKRKRAVLVYLYAEPASWQTPEKRPIAPEMIERHAEEVDAFATAINGGALDFRYCTYRQLLNSMRASPMEGVRNHAEALSAKFADLG